MKAMKRGVRLVVNVTAALVLLPFAGMAALYGGEHAEFARKYRGRDETPSAAT